MLKIALQMQVHGASRIALMQCNAAPKTRMKHDKSAIKTAS
jgi:hypothetical protein